MPRLLVTLANAIVSVCGALGNSAAAKVANFQLDHVNSGIESKSVAPTHANFAYRFGFPKSIFRGVRHEAVLSNRNKEKRNAIRLVVVERLFEFFDVRAHRNSHSLSKSSQVAIRENMARELRAMATPCGSLQNFIIPIACRVISADISMRANVQCDAITDIFSYYFNGDSSNIS